MATTSHDCNGWSNFRVADPIHSAFSPSSNWPRVSLNHYRTVSNADPTSIPAEALKIVGVAARWSKSLRRSVTSFPEAAGTRAAKRHLIGSATQSVRVIVAPTEQSSRQGNLHGSASSGLAVCSESRAELSYISVKKFTSVKGDSKIDKERTPKCRDSG